MVKRKKVWEESIKCPYCGYNNKKYNIELYGTCTGCKKTIDKKAKYKYEMNKRLRLWRKDI